MTVEKRIIKNTGFVFISSIANKLFAAFFIAYAARVLGPGDFGLYAFIGAIGFLFFSFANFGIGPMAVREISREKEKAKLLFNNVLALRISIVLLAYPILILVVNVLGYKDNVKQLVYIVGLTAVFSTFSNSFKILYMAYEKFKVPSLVSILVSFLSSVFNILALYYGYGLKGIVIISLIGNVLGAAISGIWLRKKFFKYKFSFNLSVWKDLTLQSIPYAVILFFQQTNRFLNILLLSRLPGPLPSELAMGYYNPPSSINKLTMMLPYSLKQAALPTVSANVENTQLIKDIIKGSTEKLLVLIVFPLIVATTFFPTEIITIIFGEAYLPSVTAFIVLGWASALQVFNTPVSMTLSATREIKKFIPWSILIFCVNLILAVPLIIYYSFLGAAIAFLVSKVIETFLRNYLLKTVWGISRLGMKESFKVLIPMASVFFILLILHLYSVNNIIILIIAIMSYLLCVFSMRGFRRKILEILRREG